MLKSSHRAGVSMKYFYPIATSTLVLSWLAVPANAIDPPGQPIVPSVVRTDVSTQNPGTSSRTFGDPEFLTDNSFDEQGPARFGRFVAGAGVYYLKPYFPGNQAYDVTVNNSTYSSGLSSTTNSSQQQDFSYAPAFAPLVWLGYVGDGGLGGRARWWHFQQGDTTTAINNNDGNNQTTITSASPRG